MFERKDAQNTVEAAAAASQPEEGAAQAPAREAIPEKAPTAAYIMEKIDAIMADTAHIREAFEALKGFEVNDSMNGGFGDQARGEAITSIVKCRETTNQKLIELLTRMYDGLAPAKAAATSPEAAWEATARKAESGEAGWEAKAKAIGALSGLMENNYELLSDPAKLDVILSKFL